MSDAWVYQGSDISLDKLESLIDSLKDISSTLSTYMDLVAKGTQAGSILMQDGSNAYSSILDQAAKTVESSVNDLLHNNVAMALHINLDWDPDWTYAQYKKKGTIPWIGGGLDKWLLDLAASAKDKSDPFRPLTDTDTKVGGVIFLQGVPSGNELRDLVKIFNAFTDFKDFKDLLNLDLLDQAKDTGKALLRLGAAGFSGFIQEVSGVPEEISTAANKEVNTTKPFRGAYPKWLSVPVASLVPAVTPVFGSLHSAVGSMRLAGSVAHQVDLMVKTLEKRAQLLDEAVERLTGTLSTLEGIIQFLTGCYILFLPPEPGGMDGFVGRSQNAANLPKFGDHGIVAGITLVATTDDPLNHLEAFLEFLGLQKDQLTADATTRWNNLQAQYANL